MTISEEFKTQRSERTSMLRYTYIYCIFLAFSASLFHSFYHPFSCSLFQESALQHVRFLLCLLLLHISSSTIITFLYIFSLQSHTCTHVECLEAIPETKWNACFSILCYLCKLL